jgi:hypothetical protein
MGFGLLAKSPTKDVGELKEKKMIDEWIVRRVWLEF